MKKSLSNLFAKKSFVLIVSVLLAIFAWLLVISNTNPIVTRTLEIPIDFLHENAPNNLDLQDQTLTYPKTVTVTVSGRQDTINNLSTSELHTSCDMEAISQAGETEIPVIKPACDRVGVTVTDYYPKSIVFTYDKTTNKNLEVQVKYDNDLLKKDYQFISVTKSLSSIPVSGFASLLDTLSYARIDLSDSIAAGSLDSDITAAFLVKYISETGEDISHHFTPEKVTVEIKVAKKVPLKYTVKGTPHADSYYTGDKISADYVLVQGPYETLKDISEINLGEVSMEGKDASFEVYFDVSRILPAEVSVYGNSTVTVSVSLESLVTKTYKITQNSINFPGKDDTTYEYTISPWTVTVTIKGKESDLAALPSNETDSSFLQPTVDLSGKTVGTYSSLGISFPGLDTSKFSLVGNYTMKVVIKTIKIEPPIEEKPETKVETEAPVEE